MKKLLTIAAILASTAFVNPASAASIITGNIKFNNTAPVTAYSSPNASATFNFKVEEPFAAGDPAVALDISNFTYFLGASVTPLTDIKQVNFWTSANGGMFDLVFNSGTVLNIYGIDIGSSGSVTPGFYFPPTEVLSIGIDGSTGIGRASVAADKVAPVPEASTWAMMLAGFGAIGFAMRRRQNVRVSFA